MIWNVCEITRFSADATPAIINANKCESQGNSTAYPKFGKLIFIHHTNITNAMKWESARNRIKKKKRIQVK